MTAAPDLLEGVPVLLFHLAELLPGLKVWHHSGGEWTCEIEGACAAVEVKVWDNGLSAVLAGASGVVWRSEGPMTPFLLAVRLRAAALAYADDLTDRAAKLRATVEEG